VDLYQRLNLERSNARSIAASQIKKAYHKQALVVGGHLGSWTHTVPPCMAFVRAAVGQLLPHMTVWSVQWMCEQWHPDKHSDKGIEGKKVAEQKFKAIGLAYAILSDANKKSR
jgi:hypothetical protein